MEKNQYYRGFQVNEAYNLPCEENPTKLLKFEVV